MKEKEIAFKRREKINWKEKTIEKSFPRSKRENRHKEQSGGEAVNLQNSEWGNGKGDLYVNKWTNENINIWTRKYVNKEKDKKLKI